MELVRVIKQFIAIGAVLYTTLTGVASTARAQGNPTSAPQSVSSTGTITGTVFDENRDVLQGAEVTLTNSSAGWQQTVDSDSDGSFVFAKLRAGTFSLKVTGHGLGTFVSSQISLHAGEVRILPPIILVISGGVTSVTVSGNKEELADEQVRIAVQQRIGGIIPNFYSSYDWNAPPMQSKQKLKLSVRSIIDPVSFLAVAGVAGAEQYQNVFPDYGSGIEGYGKRYGAALANHVSATLLCRGVYPSIFHQDPRYFYKGKGSFGSRALYAVSAAVIARDDDGRWKPNYSNVLGNFSAAAISNLYYPSSDQGVSLVVFNGLANTAADSAANLLREFILKKITTHVPAGANGQP